MGRAASPQTPQTPARASSEPVQLRRHSVSAAFRIPAATVPCLTFACTYAALLAPSPYAAFPPRFQRATESSSAAVTMRRRREHMSRTAEYTRTNGRGGEKKEIKGRKGKSTVHKTLTTTAFSHAWSATGVERGRNQWALYSPHSYFHVRHRCRHLYSSKRWGACADLHTPTLTQTQAHKCYTEVASTPTFFLLLFVWYLFMQVHTLASQCHNTQTQEQRHTYMEEKHKREDSRGRNY